MPYYSKTLNSTFTKQIDKELRASHAGETGAVWIYRGALFAEFIRGLFRVNAQKSDTTLFIHEHLKTEKQHLDIFENEMPIFRGSFVLPLWITAGFLTGFIPRMCGANWFFYTIYCVETFVDEHYEAQCGYIESLTPTPSNVLSRFRQCQEDEQHHRDEALSLMTTPPSVSMKLWGNLVGRGSSIAVVLAKLI